MDAEMIEIKFGDLLDQQVDAVINTWNRNHLPWFLLWPSGVSGAIKKRGGSMPFRELRTMDMIPLGGAVITGPGRLPYRAIIHVAGINLLWRASATSIADATRSAVQIAYEENFGSIAMPVIGSGSGGFAENEAIEVMVHALREIDAPVHVRIVQFQRRT